MTAFVVAFQVPKEQAGPRRLAGEARDAVEHLDMMTDLAADRALDKLLAALGAHFVEEEWDKIDEIVTA